jgi:hypothetical protein
MVVCYLGLLLLVGLHPPELGLGLVIGLRSLGWVGSGLGCDPPWVPKYPTRGPIYDCVCYCIGGSIVYAACKLCSLQLQDRN